MVEALPPRERRQHTQLSRYKPTHKRRRADAFKALKSYIRRFRLIVSITQSNHASRKTQSSGFLYLPKSRASNSSSVPLITPIKRKA